MKKFVNFSFCTVFVLAVCLAAGCKAPSGGGGSGSGGGGGSEQGGGGGGSNISTPTKVDEQTIEGTTYDIVTFGTFPQSEKDSTVSITSESKIVGSFTYYKGDDNEWYAELNSKYYKVEPIKWRVLTTNYDHDGNASTPGKKLLFAENILINKPYDDDSNSYADSTIRNYLKGDFLTIAFTQAEQDAIAATIVVNNAESTNPDGNATLWNNGANQNAGDPTEDTIFLLSEQEATKAEYGFGAYNECKGDGTHNDSTRIRMTTAFAKANGAWQSSTYGYGGCWWLRSPNCSNSNDARDVDGNGDAYYKDRVYSDSVGVVPALCLN